MKGEGLSEEFRSPRLLPPRESCFQRGDIGEVAFIPGRKVSMSMFRSLFSSPDEEITTSYTAAPSFLDRARGAVGLQPTRREELVDSCCPRLTFRQRVYGFAICFCLGAALSFLSMMFFRQLLAGDPGPFAVNYTMGNMLALGSTLFLVGPRTQLKRMSSPTRGVTALVFILAMVGTLFCALILPQLAPTLLPPPKGRGGPLLAILIIVCISVQFCAGFWCACARAPALCAPTQPTEHELGLTNSFRKPTLHVSRAHRYALSYIPYGRRMFRVCCENMADT
jgi:hypothetical protein